MGLLRLSTEAAVVDEAARLEALGIELIDSMRSPAIYAQCIHIAKRLRDTGKQVIGLWPADDLVGVPSLAVQVGLALADLAASTVAFVDANVRWPAAQALIARGDLVSSTEDEGEFTTLWLRGMVALLIPRTVGGAGEGLARLRLTVEGGRSLFGYMLVDMTGFDVLGDHLNVVDLLDGVAIVAAARRSTDEDLIDLATQIDAHKLLGAVLVDR